MSKAKSKLALLILVLCVAIALANRLFEFRKTGRLKIPSETVLVTGTVVACEKSWRSGAFNVQFIYEYNGRSLKKEQHFKYVYRGELVTALRHKTFPVLVSIKDEANAHLMIFPEDFAAFNRHFPDSLQWVKAFMTE